MTKRSKKKFPRGLKKNFVEALPLEMSTADVVDKGKAEGVELNAHQVSNIRWLMKNPKAKPPKQQKPPKLPKGPRIRTKRQEPEKDWPNNANRLAVANNANRLSAAGAQAEHARARGFRHMAMQIGLVKARSILDEREDSSESPQS